MLVKDHNTKRLHKYTVVYVSLITWRSYPTAVWFNIFVDAQNHLDNSNDGKGVTSMWDAGKHCNNTPITSPGQ